MNLSAQYKLAWKLSQQVHETQTDLGGAPYIWHVRRVARDVHDDHDLRLGIVGLLHDSIEDGGLTAEKLLEMGFSGDVVDAVVAITRLPDEDYTSYIDRVAKNPYAAEVKKADLRDNMDLTRIVKLTDGAIRRVKKYHAAYKRLSFGEWA